MRIAYLVHDLSDPAVDRRVRMLQAGGADVALFGFRRSGPRVAQVAGAPAVDLGRTRDLELVSRVTSVAQALAAVGGWSGGLAKADAVLARNLEMLMLARAAMRASAARATLNYELLDVHRLLVGRTPLNAGLRTLESALLRDTDLALISSPAFEVEYFKRWSRPVRRTLIVENKVFAANGAASPAARVTRAGPPWRVGWFGMLRCQRSLDLLCDLAREAAGLVQVDIRGRPTRQAFRDFDAQVVSAPNVGFGGPYKPAEIPKLYGAVHFTWSIDFFEEGLNSAWLLPNRLYEGQLHGAVPIALRQVETGRWLARRGAGLLLDDPDAELLSVLKRLSQACYEDLAQRTAVIPRSDLVCGEAECQALVQTLVGRAA